VQSYACGQWCVHWPCPGPTRRRFDARSMGGAGESYPLGVRASRGAEQSASTRVWARKACPRQQPSPRRGRARGAICSRKAEFAARGSQPPSVGGACPSRLCSVPSASNVPISCVSPLINGCLGEERGGPHRHADCSCGRGKTHFLRDGREYSQRNCLQFMLIRLLRQRLHAERWDSGGHSTGAVETVAVVVNIGTA
jgi:hypothetical protein